MERSHIKEWAVKLRKTHKNPNSTLELPGSKLFILKDQNVVKEVTTTALNSLKELLMIERSERRCARSTATWFAEQNLIELIKVVRDIRNFGYTNNKVRYLLLEEALFLLESNRLELQWDNIPLSMEQAYNLLGITFSSYLIYKELALNGFRIVKRSDMCLTSFEEPPKKKIKYKSSNKPVHTFKLDTFVTLRERGPRNVNFENIKVCDYELFQSTGNRSFPDYDLHMFHEECLEPKIALIKSRQSLIVCASVKCTGFFNITSIDLPNLI